MKMKVKRSWLFAAAVLIGCLCAAPALPHLFSAHERTVKIENADGGLEEGWKQVVEIPAWISPAGETLLRSATVTLWVEKDWFSVRRNEANGELEWQVVLARRIAGEQPIVKVGQPTGLDLSYGEYFLRENVGRVRVLREKKDEYSPAWPKPEIEEQASSSNGWATWPEKSTKIEGRRHNDWRWAFSGLPSGKYDVWLRLEHKDLHKKKPYGFESGPKPPRMFFGDMFAVDEGDLFYAERSLAEVSEKALARQRLVEHFSEQPAPPIDASEWLNSPVNSLDGFRDKVVLLDFWGTWCTPCVANLPKVQALYEKYNDRGFVVIGVHSSQGNDGVATFLEKKREITFPIAIDTGKTFESYGIEGVPAYFLIDKSGKCPWGFSTSPPSDEEIEKLLK